MIARALIGHGPSGAARRAAYADVLGQDRVRWLTADSELADDVVVDLDDPDALPADLRDRLLDSEALIVAGAPLFGSEGKRMLAAWPDLLEGAIPAMAADLDALGPRTMSKSIVVTEAPGLGPSAWNAVLALIALGGGLQRIAARSQPHGAGFAAIYGVGRFHDGSIAYVEAVAGAPPGTGLRIYEALGRGGIREFDSRRSINRIIRGGAATSLPATQTQPYARLAAGLCRAARPGPPAELAPVLADAHAAYAALLQACDSGTAVAL